MRMTLEIYQERIDEIELYFNALKELYQTQSRESEHSFYNDDFLKILKANALIMIYNLVESSIMGGILEIYDELKNSGYSYKDVRKEIQDIWFSFKFNQVYDKTAHYNSYRDKAAEIINAIMRNEPIEMDRKATDISGNLDADKIRQICSDHGITYTIDSTCRAVKGKLYDNKKKEIYLVAPMYNNKYSFILSFFDEITYKTIRSEIYNNRDKIIVVAGEWKSSGVYNSFITHIYGRKQVAIIK